MTQEVPIDTDALLARLQEAEALYDALSELLDEGCPTLGSDWCVTECAFCGHTVGLRGVIRHSNSCAWGRAEKARDRWEHLR